MGAGMARSLLRHGIEVSAWNRTRAKADPLAEQGAQIASSPGEAVRDADLVMTMLYDADSVVEVAQEALPAVQSGPVWVQSSTIGLEGTDRAAAVAARFGVPYVDAPVLGTKGPAEQGQLVVLAAGADELRERVTPAFEAMGSRTLWVGTEPGRASALKLACNAWVASITAATGQSVALAGRLGLDPRLFLEAIDGGPVGSPYAQAKGGAMIAGEFLPQFELDGVVKDLGLIRDAEEASGTATTLTDALLACFGTASERGHGAEDMAAVVAAFRPQ